jgi:hypothetical protein
MATRNGAKRLRAELAKVACARVLALSDLVWTIVQYGTLVDLARLFGTCSAVSSYQTLVEFRRVFETANNHQFKLEYPDVYAGLLLVSPQRMASNIMVNWRKLLYPQPTLTYKCRTRLAEAAPFKTLNKIMLLITSRGQSPHFRRGRFMNVFAVYLNGVLELLEYNTREKPAHAGIQRLYQHNLSVVEGRQGQQCFLTHIDDIPLSAFHGITSLQTHIAEKRHRTCKLSMILLEKHASKSAIPTQCKIPRVDHEDAYWNDKIILI